MKLCSQCEFIYEDNQERCDMDGAELVYEPTLEGAFQTALEAKSERERPARLIIPLTRSPQPETAAAPPNVLAARGRFALQIAAGIVLAVVAFVAFYTLPRLFHSRAQTSRNTLETSHSSAAISGAPATSDKPETANAKFETPPSSDNTQSRNARRETSLPSDKFETSNSKRATPIPALPGLKPLPRLKPLPTLKPIPRLADRSRSVSAGRKTIVVNTSTNTKKESRFGSFLKKTGRVLSKPFKP